MKQKPIPINPEVEKTCEAVLSAAFLGIHHVPYWDRRRACGPDGMAVTTYADMSTFDGDELTRLVIAAHDHAVRVSVCPSGPRMLTIRMWPRKREGGTWERHPEIEEAVERVRKWTRPTPEPAPSNPGTRPMRRVDCTGIDLTSIHVDADKIVYCQRYVTNTLSPRIAIYFSTDSAAEPLNVLELQTTMDDLMPRGDANG